MSNLPEVKIGVVAVSRDCFPESLSVNRRKALMKAYTEKYGTDSVYECPVCIVESEIHMVQALEDIKKAGCNALCVYLGNFGPEISETLLAKHFDGPAMFIAAAEETQNDLVGGRGDAYCGMLNASYNLKLRNVKAYIPENPVGTAAECADMLHEFISIARAIGVDGIKVTGSDSTNADKAVDTISDAIKQVSKQRSALGAVQNRLEHTINNLDNVVENTTSAESQIRDTDMATEMVKYSNNNILAQAGQAMLAQSNQANQGVLSLLQ